VPSRRVSLGCISSYPYRVCKMSRCAGACSGKACPALGQRGGYRFSENDHVQTI